MRATILIFFCIQLMFIEGVFGQKQDSLAANSLEFNELNTIRDILFKGKKNDSLIEWSNPELVTSEYYDEKVYELEYKNYRWVSFIINEYLGNRYLKSIEYLHMNAPTTVLKYDSLNSTKINEQTNFKVYTSKDKLRHYCCVIDSEEIMIWWFSLSNKIIHQKTIKKI
jgi:hypothetical protein